MAERRGIIQTANFPRITGGRLEIPAAIGDPDFSSVTLLLDFAGVDGATDITDLSDSAHVDTFIGTTEVDTAVQLLGGNSIVIDGSGDEGVSFPDNADWDIGTGDFTWECHVQFAFTSATYAFISNSNGTNGAWLRWASSGNLQFLNDASLVKAEAWSPATDTPYHVAVTRQGTSIRLFVDGVEFGSATTSATDIQQGGPLRIGSKTTSSEPMNGNIGAVRITKGAARYTAGFTPPTVFYPTS